MLCSQFGEKVVNACSRAHLHRPNDADVDPPPMLFVHITHFASRAKSPIAAGCRRGARCATPSV